MASEREIFEDSGPLYLTAVDWDNFHHKRSVAASLVQGVYNLERDRQQNRQDHQSQASPWWSSFRFELIKQLKDGVDSSIFGAIYRYNNPSVRHHKCPINVIAFRGTLTKPGSMFRDIKLDIKVFLSKLHQDSRFHLALQAVQDVVAKIGTANIWLAGHSLGAAIALLVGKNMAREDYPIETYLFNPPFISFPKLKPVIRIASSFLKATIAPVMGKHQTDDSFFALSGWFPHLFVNPDDHVCSGYIGYFEHRKKMAEIGAAKIERRATQISTGNMIFGKQEGGCEPLHLLPSANLTINVIQSPDFKRAHGILQWWDRSFHGRSERHQLRGVAHMVECSIRMQEALQQYFSEFL
ncbi:GDSL esterase/lipase At4g10955-like [Mangifera indica]|uniref:GDSL esterase/lipase At4g10955-like n=1 Tax=Mangifera indica TaxID=29780 RepID=UPI001CFC383F|nr:GDSL esterase/lipase At4g10955-like [Mangifera indica]